MGGEGLQDLQALYHLEVMSPQDLHLLQERLHLEGMRRDIPHPPSASRGGGVRNRQLGCIGGGSLPSDGDTRLRRVSNDGVDAPLRGASSRVRMVLAATSSSPRTPSAPSTSPERPLVLRGGRSPTSCRCPPLSNTMSERVRTLTGGCAGTGQNHTIASTFLGTLSLKKGPPRMLKVTILELFKAFHGHAAAGKSIFRFFQSTFDLGALFTLKD